MDEMTSFISQYTLVTGHIDLVKSDNYYSVKDFSGNDIWIRAGGENEMVYNAIEDGEFSVEREGCYYFTALMTYDGGQYDSYGRCECRPYMEIQHIEFDFICTFESREREQKLNKLLPDFDLDFFK